MASNNRNRGLILQQAAIDLAKKLRLEPALARAMRKLLHQIIADFKKRYYKSQFEVLNVDDYKQQLAEILHNHYLRVTNAFAGSTLRQITSKKSLTDDIQDAVHDLMANYLLVKSENHARIILSTVKTELDEAILKAVHEAVAAGKQPDPKVISNLVSQDFIRKINGKAEIISITETQETAEKTKFEEFLQYQDVVADPTEELMLKEWVAILDSKTRAWHAEADGQRVGINDTFIVKGEALMYPGDASLGVSLDNIIGCRCTSYLVRL